MAEEVGNCKRSGVGNAAAGCICHAPNSSALWPVGGMLLQPQLAAGYPTPPSLIQKFIVGLQEVPAGWRMPEMITQRPAAHIPFPQTGIHQAHRQFRVFPAPAHKSLVISINPEQVVSPNGQVAASDTP